MKETEKVTLVNLTPHSIALYEGVNCIKIWPSEGFARAEETRTTVEDDFPYPLETVTFGMPKTMPSPEEGIIYIVSYITGMALKSLNRSDFVIPGEAVRDDKGRIIGCRGFSKL